MALPNNIGDETSEVIATQAHILNHVLNYIISMSIKCAIQLEIPDIIYSHGRAMTLSNLLNALPINKLKGHDCIYRLMRILIHAGFFIQGEESYLLTPTSRLLLKNDPLSLALFVQAQLDPILMDLWHSLSEWFTNRDSTPFATTHGKPLFEYAGDDPRVNRLLNEAMGRDARLIISVLIKNGKGVFEGLKSLVDVGGGTGTVAKAISNAFPELKCSVFDLPHVVEGLEGGNNLSYIGGDMFKSVPSAHAILLKWILHDWSDEDYVKILKKCKEAIPSKENGGKVIVIDIVIDNEKRDNKSLETQLFSDVLMMVHVSGKERNEQEWVKLFSDSGFSHYKISHILGLRSVIEVYP
ncbi:trans-resveratrol di-O-methyltransferase-like [Solanum verrucosum]|uniref:trans-resveratrol di-O-methyltransferase-like n=1 Tax=Solanum verrucosum TaxID=315347 RepID=UPI0020D124C1|nr:trans-resveratrol di-O-methyltransferase-like [Solanum verrucosum]